MSAAPPHDVVYPMAPGTLRQVPAVDVAAYLAKLGPHARADWEAVLGDGLVPVEVADRITKSGAAPEHVAAVLHLAPDQLGPRALRVRQAFEARPNRAARRARR